MAGRQLASKWLKTGVLLNDPRVARYIPKTKSLTITNLQMMLRQYGVVVVKPDVGAGGHGVIQIKYNAERYKITHGSSSFRYSGFAEMYNMLLKLKKPKSYLIQQGIHLATIHGRPIDYRVKVVKDGKGWTFRSMVGRLAKPGLFVTNLCRGGTQLSCKEGLRRSLPYQSVNAKRKEMSTLTTVCTTIMERKFPGISQLGFDYGVDVKGRIWIFEVNTRPQ
ncbi:hypothetical protein PMSD_03705 [Paenibacillus macquariensis subsp. defensor]|nr:hypothetical protein PMSD_03705 [Paenibacillus macquariensis subsp. defensor]